MVTLSRIRVHPIKALDPVELEQVRISPVGGLDGDRTYAIVDGDGEYVNGKRTAAVHRLDAEVDLDATTVTIGVRGSGERYGFHLDRERGALSDWLSTYFDYEVDVVDAHGGEFADSRVFGGTVAGATVVSTATIETVASWFSDLDVDVEDVRRRFRANLEIEGVEAFWEDRLVGDGGVRLQIGGTTFEGVKPISRCVVPTRDPDTGEPTDGFRERFVERREETFPAWIDPGTFEHAYVLTVLAHPEEDHRGETIHRGDPVELIA